jgi:hypothetical protein
MLNRLVNLWLSFVSEMEVQIKDRTGQDRIEKLGQALNEIHKLKGYFQ